ncbi:MAG: hypothetical protein HRU38_04995 [Saccharospirillaceae bacterium]|nr:hypothetical protein [Saccharospirillaceae bacterium]
MLAKSLISVLVLSLSLASSNSYAKYNILVLDLKGWTTADGLSEGNILLNDFLSFTNLDVEILQLPNARAIRAILNYNYHCLFTGSKEAFFEYTQREALSIENLQITYWRYFRSINLPVITDLEQLINLNLVTLNGINISAKTFMVEPSIFNNIDKVQNIPTIIKMLNLGRADVGYFTVKQDETISGLHYDPNLKSLRVSRGLNCAKDNSNSKILIDEFNRFLTFKNQ